MRPFRLTSALILLFAGQGAHSFVYHAPIRSSSRPAFRLSAATSTTITIDAPPSSSSSITSISSPQLLEFVEPSTNVTVVLVGAMHYNPTSVRLAEDTVLDLGLAGRLGSVVIESCDVRWNKTGELYEESPAVEKFLTNEMRIASDAAMGFGRPVVLGDQRINVTVDALKAAFQETLSDLASPLNGGWGNVTRNIAGAAREALPSGSGYLGPLSFFDSNLLLAAPVSFVKYPLAFLFRSPLLVAIVLTLVANDVLGPFNNNNLDLSDTGELTQHVAGLGDVVLSLSFAFLETVVFARLLLKELLAERNEILAKNILEQCKIYADTTTNSNSNSNNGADAWSLPAFFSSIAQQLQLTTTTSPSDMMPAYDSDGTRIFYAEKFGRNKNGSDEATAVMEKIRLYNDKNDISVSEDGKVVVAILGMAHCNGIMKLLKEQRIS